MDEGLPWPSMRLEACTIGHGSWTTYSVVGIAVGVALTLVLDGCDLVVDGRRRGGSAEDFGSLVRDERADLQCSVQIASNLDL